VPEAVGEGFEVGDGCGVGLEPGVNGEAGVQAAEYGEREGDEGVEGSDRGAGPPGVGGEGEFFEGELEVKEEAEALEAVTDGVEAKEEELVLGGEELAGLALEGRGVGAAECAGDVEVEGEGVLDVEVELEGGGVAAPGAVVVVGDAGSEAGSGEDALGAGEIGGGDEEVEVAAGAEGGRAVETLGEGWAFEGDGGDAGLMEGAQDAR
jgi:hypothetical protein